MCSADPYPFADFDYKCQVPQGSLGPLRNPLRGWPIPCFFQRPYLSWQFLGSLINEWIFLHLPACTEEKIPGIGAELFTMFMAAVIYFILLMMKEYGVSCRSTKALVAFQANYPTDEDVIAEAERVHAVVFRPATAGTAMQFYPAFNNTTNPALNEVVIVHDKKDEAIKVEEAKEKDEDVEKAGQIPPSNDVPVKQEEDAVQMEFVVEPDSIVVQNLCKSYKDFAAVSNLSFGVKHGECFGLLGVNGAGKTTTFRMLTGDETPSDGDAFVGNFGLRNNRKEFVKQFGYCPQSDPLVGFMTGREMLNLYGRLRGVPGSALKQQTTKWLKKLGLADAGNDQCRTYSGGMKRRLSAGVSLMGNPPIVLMDEPTSGVDPVSRREFWKIVSSVKEAGQAVIFTSHSMDECEALCTRLGIMVNGQFQCFGGAAHIRQKFGEGYSLTVKLTTSVPVDNVETNTGNIMENSLAVMNLQNDIFRTFQNAFLKEVHSNLMHYQLLNVMTWDVVFKLMEEVKARHNNVDDYSICETTLEQVFLTFARQQQAPRKA